MAPLAAAGLLLDARSQQSLMRAGSWLNDRASALMFRPSHLAPTFGDHEVTPIERFPLNSYLVDDPDIDLDSWRLELSGLVRHPGEYALDVFRRLPKVVQNTRHICIEGWDVIGNFGGVRVADFFSHVGVDTGARYVEIQCADDYYESIDMPSALHPQSLLCYEMYGGPLPREHGAPMRLVMPTKLGYKQAKYVVALTVTNVRSARRGYWEDQGYGWYGGV